MNTKSHWKVLNKWVDRLRESMSHQGEAERERLTECGGTEELKRKPGNVKFKLSLEGIDFKGEWIQYDDVRRFDIKMCWK